MLLFLLLLATTVGRRIADCLPNPLKESTAFYIAPLLGLASLILLTTVYGWLSPFRTGISLSISTALLVLGIALEKQRKDLFIDWAITCAFATVVTIPIFAPLIRFDSFNPFNDTFTYLVHGQWLQEHAFSEAARKSGFFPAETQVALYQMAGHRMGGSFFLGFVQSLFRLEWSYYAYVPTVAFVFAVGSLAIGGIIRQVIPVSKTVCLALCTVPAFSMNSFLFGAQFGFFPQTFGLALCSGLTCLIPALAAYSLHSRPTWAKQFLYQIPPALCCSALLFSYNDMFPIVGAGIGLFLLLVCLLYWSEKYRVIGPVLILAAQVLVLVNIEGIRILRNLVHTVFGAATGAVHFGWPMYWSPIQFLAHSFGMKSPFQSDVFVVDRIISIWVFPVLLIMIVAILTKILRDKPRNLTILFLICINFIFLLGFAKFRYATPGLAGEVGHTFLQFKLSQWASPFNLGLLGIVSAWLLLKAVRYRSICSYAFLTAFVAGMYFQNVTVSQMFTTQLQDETMRMHSPFNVFLELRSRVANIPKEQVIYLGFPAEHHKITQMVSYVLSDRRLASNYEDGYLRGSIPEHERNMPVEKADWLIQRKPTPTFDENPLNRVGPFVIRRAPFSFYSLESITGAHATETGDKKTWNWVKDSVEYRFRSIGKTPKTRVKFQFLLAGKPRTLFLELDTSSGKRITSFKIPMTGGWGDYESPVIETNSEDIIVRLKADGEPIRLSSADSREAKFLIQNLALDSGKQTLEETPFDRIGQSPVYTLESISGAYNTETGNGKTWNWVKESVEYRYHSVGKTHKAKVKFQFLLSGKPRTLFLELSTYSGKKIASFNIPMKGGWGDYESPFVVTNSGDLIIRLRADGNPTRLSTGDPREAKFLIQNLSVDSGS